MSQVVKTGGQGDQAVVFGWTANVICLWQVFELLCLFCFVNNLIRADLMVNFHIKVLFNKHSYKDDKYIPI